MNSLLKKLKLEAVNPGACLGPEGWIHDPAGRELVSDRRHSYARGSRRPQR